MSDSQADPPGSDRRHQAYEYLHDRQLPKDIEKNRRSAEVILRILRGYYSPSSILDVGCGLGTWLAAALRLGIDDVRGVDGPWLDFSRLEISPERVEKRDLEKPFDLERRFDLVISLEVAEHLSAEAASTFVSSLVRHAPAVLFSAAIPFQGGTHHVNERFLPYWIELFKAHDFKPIDLVRSEIWDDDGIHFWLRQNVVLFAHDSVIAANEKLRTVLANQKGPLSVVHPVVYVGRLEKTLEKVSQLEPLLEIVKEGGLFRSTVDGKGKIVISRVK